MNVHASVVESPESSSPMVTRAVAAGLNGEFARLYPLEPWQRLILSGLGRLPQRVGREVISRFQSVSGIPAQRLAGLSVNTLAEARLADYAKLRGPFPSVVLGAPLGGAAAHISIALGAPFLPQAFVTTLKGGARSGAVQEYFQRSADLALEIADNNPGVLTIQHFDPVHDGWLTRYVNHLRFKLLDLPAAYQAFIQRNLQPGGYVYYLDCAISWLRFRVGERSFFQVGGWGDIPPQEFIEGSDRLRNYCRAADLRFCDWCLPGYPLESGPESEWGSEPDFGAAVAAFCRQEGYSFSRISLPEPHDYSRLAFEMVVRQLEKEGREPAGVFIEMFSQYDATAVQETGLLPIWLVFNTRDSLAFLREMTSRFPKDKPVFFSPLATFSLTPDIVPWSDWEAALQGFNWMNIGTRPSHYPSDALTLVGWADPLRRWVADNRRPILSPLKPEEIHQVFADIRD